jgi:Tfp pilus tip-associated adhesin PilY1
MNNLNNTSLVRTNMFKGCICHLMLPFILMLSVSGAQAAGLASDYTSVPPLIDVSGTSNKPNVLLVLDNSNSMDEAANGSAVGSDSKFSKSEIARAALKSIVNNFGDASRLGLMGYKQSSIASRRIHNSPYDVSYNPGNFDPSFTGARDSQTKRYRIPNPTNPGAFIYYNIALPFYAGGNYGNAFCHSSTADFDNGSEVVNSGPWDNYACYRNKTNTSNSFPSGFSSKWFNSSFYPTDSDYAQDILDFGKFMTWHYVGRTWFSNSSPGKGMLHLGINDVDAAHKTKLLNKLATSQFSTNTDTPLRNAGLTPIAGTLNSAKSYFAGTLPASETASGASNVLPAANFCGNENDYVVMVTDGLPSVDASGNQITNTNDAIAAAAAAAADLLSTTKVKTFVVGFALPNGVDASVLDTIAIAGGTTRAYKADDEASLNQALGSIFLSIINRTSSSTGAAVLANNTRGEGAVYQASYNPHMEDADGNTVSWVGGLQGLFIDQLGFFREDTNSNKTLDGYDTDYIVQYFYDTVENRARIRVFVGTSASVAPNTTGAPTTIKEVSELKVIWQARDQLSSLTNTTSQRDYSSSAASGRHIVTSITGTDLTDFIKSSDVVSAENALLDTLNLAEDDVTSATTGLDGAKENVDDTKAELVTAQFEADYRQNIVTTVDAFDKLEQAEINAYDATFAKRNREQAEQDVFDAQLLYDALIAGGAPVTSPEVIAAKLALDGKKIDLINAQGAEAIAQADLDTANAALALAQSNVAGLDAQQQLIANVILAEQAQEVALANQAQANEAYSQSVIYSAAMVANEAAKTTIFNTADSVFTDAQTAYGASETAASNALTARDGAVDAVPEAITAWDTAKTAVSDAQTAYSASETDASDALTIRDNAVDAVPAAQTAFNTADTAFTDAQTAFNASETAASNALTTKNAAVDAVPAAQTAADTADTDFTDAQTAYNASETTASSALITKNAAVDAVPAAQTASDTADTAFTGAQTAYDGSVTTANSTLTARDNAVVAAEDSQTNYNTVLDDAGGDTNDPSVVEAQGSLDDANLLVNKTNSALEDADQVVVDRQDELTTATTDKSDANDALGAANQWVIDTNTALTDANQAVIDRHGELTTATTDRTTASGLLLAAHKLVIDTKEALTDANQDVIDRQYGLTTTTTARSAANDALSAANQLVTDTNTALADANQDVIDRREELDLATTASSDAKAALDAANQLVVDTNTALTNADQAVIDRQDELDSAATARTIANSILAHATALRVTAEAAEVAAATVLTAANQVVTDAAADAQLLQAQFDQNAYYQKGDILIDPNDLAGALIVANDNLTTAIEGSGADGVEGADGLNNKIANAQTAADNLSIAETALDTAHAAKVTAQSAFDAAVLAVLNNKLFLHYLMESSGTEANKLVNYIRGEEQTGYRSRTIDIDGDGDTEVWRLGDIVHSTPALVGAPSDSYDALYNDSTYAAYREQYKNRRQMVYIGANDGMLHAFNAGFWNEADKKFELDDGFVTTSSTLTQHPLGSEVWSYIPRSVLPHLKWLKDTGYAHSYYVDGEPSTFDVNIFPVDADHPFGWGTILVIGLRFGGGEIDVDTDGDTVNDTTTYSSYVVMDVTNPEKPPRLISEISHSELGFTTSKPAVAKKRIPATGSSYTTTKENSWQLVFGSGPTEISDATSTQNAKLFVYDLVAKSFVTGFAPNDISSQTNSFVGDISVANWDNDFVDDTAYFGVISGTPDTPTGQVMRYRLGQSSSTAITTFVDTNRATVGKPLPVVDGNGRKWIYFGTGRLFDGKDNGSTSLQRYYGVMEPVNTLGEVTWAAASTTTLQDVSDIKIFDNGDLTTSGSLEIPSGTAITTYNALKSSLPAHKGGWFRDLYQESAKPTGRNISASAKARSIIFFTEYKPADNACQPEGTSLLYGVDYQTGTAVPFAVFGSDSTVTNNDGELAVASVELGQGNSSAPVVVENNSSSVSGTTDSVVTVITQLSSEVTRADAATTGTYATGRESWMQIELD